MVSLLQFLIIFLLSDVTIPQIRRYHIITSDLVHLRLTYNIYGIEITGFKWVYHLLILFYWWRCLLYFLRLSNVWLYFKLCFLYLFSIILNLLIFVSFFINRNQFYIVILFLKIFNFRTLLILIFLNYFNSFEILLFILFKLLFFW